VTRTAARRRSPAFRTTQIPRGCAHSRPPVRPRPIVRPGGTNNVATRSCELLPRQPGDHTALVVLPSGGVEVVGAGAVTLLDGRRVAYTNFNEVSRGDVLALIDVKLHLLPADARFEPGEAAHPSVDEVVATVTGR
jgi:hypothetical protein